MKSLHFITKPLAALLILPIGSIALIGLSSAFASTPVPEIEKTPLPAGPLLRKMPNPSAWKITYTYDSEKKNPVTGKAGSPPQGSSGPLLGAVIRSINVKLGGYTWVAVTEDVNGHYLEQSSVDGMLFLSDSKQPSLTVNAPRDEHGQLAFGLKDFTGGEFPDLDWIRPEVYLGTQKFQGVTYLVFEQDQEGVDTKNAVLAAPRAWVNAETRLPALVRMGNCTITYEQLPTPHFPFDLPAAAKSLSKTIRERAAIFDRPIPRGG